MKSALAVTALMTTSCSTPVGSAMRAQLRSFDHFENFERTQRGGELVLVSPRLDVLPWNELIVSWNAACPPGSTLKVEARAFDGTNFTRFYNIARWSAEAGSQRTSFRNETDADATVDTDTLICRRLMSAAQVRLTLTGDKDALPQLKLVTFSFLNSSAPCQVREPNRAAWGITLSVPQRSQLGWPGASGWCSPTSLSMMLAWWSQQLHRPELDVPVPDVAHAVFDQAYGGTGNWNFNMAYAGSFEHIRAYATRFDDLREVEDCIVASVPVALSVSFDLLNGKDADMNNGHLIVIVGFTETGDVVVNDPWPNPKKENSVRKLFARDRVINAWQRSKQTVYVVLPDGVHVPREL
jgi:uncharacterized protein YvpB